MKTKTPCYLTPNYPVFLLFILGNFVRPGSLAFGQPTAIASSADGIKWVSAGIIIYGNPAGTWYGPGRIYTSVDAGATWTEGTEPTEYWTSVASSADGAKLVAVGGDIYNGAWIYPGPPCPIYTSTNSGTTWTHSAALSNYWASVASSADGTFLVAAAWWGRGDGLVYVSTNSGAGWTPTSAPANDWSSVASSADGRRLVASAIDDGSIYLSTNWGATWTLTSAPTNDWSCVASSASGDKLVAVARQYSGDGLIHISTDGGTTWMPTTAPSNYWSCVASSADGTKLVASGGGVSYVSKNSGTTWSIATGAKGCAVASSADGNRVMVGGGGYVGDYPGPAVSSPRLTIAPSGAGLGISWLVPSATFILQHSSDLTPTNWWDVTTIPRLNFTNLHYEVLVPSPPGRAFYRLKQL